MEIRVSSKAEIQIVVDEFIRLVDEGYRLFLLSGDLGAGKTALVQAFGISIGATEAVSSPTFSLVNAYDSPKVGLFYHMDFYRLAKASDLAQIGLEEYLDSGHLCFIEWPEIAKEYFFPPYVSIAIAVDQNNIRIFNITKHDTVDS
ncbi:MAG TPA: tRNA (adenosine(37)-N6)-threonylcarbamoyltransferase complex ATPase subunit type 1 TsaE [Saprospiraceae bacterium]|nr:tRNA (adenosine(37)-N6)-threonylcarbamoyltransferase complex ATPase subunit type 1 TsaE [Saprospiraceae bacterium]